MPQNPGDIRVVARATAIIQDEDGRFLLTFHVYPKKQKPGKKKEGHYFLAGGRVKNVQGDDLEKIFTHPEQAAAYVVSLFNMKRESARNAGVREIWQELRGLKLVSKMKRRVAEEQFTVIACPGAIKITNPRDAATRYRPRVDTENVILPCLMKLPPRWEKEIHRRWEKGDPRIWFATAEEIRQGLTTSSKEISPDVANILVRLGLITSSRDREPRVSKSDVDSENADSEDSEGSPRIKVASA